MTSTTARAGAPGSPTAPAPWRPLDCADWDLGDRCAATLPSGPVRDIRLLLRAYGQPLEEITLSRELGNDWSAVWNAQGSPPVELVRSLSDIGRGRLAGVHARHAPARPRVPAAAVSVIVATRGRPDALSRCLQSLLMQTHRPHEIIVVDNDPSDPRTQSLCASLAGVSWVPEPVRGASRARNTGIACATGDVLAFTDDDAVCDPAWVAEHLAAHSADPAVGCVTGLVLPARLDRQVHEWFENYGSFQKGLDPQRWSLQAPGGDHLFPWRPGRFGSGNNMSFRTDTLRALGGFDPALGPGTATHAAEDLDLFIRLLRGGGGLAYEPRALVRHHHRDTPGDLRRQVYGYGVGLGALFTKHLGERAARREILERLPRGTALLLSAASEKNASKTSDYPTRLSLAELHGVFRGPAAYLGSRRRSPAAAQAPARRPREVIDWDVDLGAAQAQREHPSGEASGGLPGGVSGGRPGGRLTVEGRDAWMLVRRGSRVLGVAAVDEATGATLASRALHVQAQAPQRAPQQAPVAAPGQQGAPAAATERAPAFSVVVPSLLARPQGLRDCLASLRSQDFTGGAELLVIDNRPGPVVMEIPDWLAAEPGMRVVRAPRPGISAARNAGLGQAVGAMVAFTDDDAVVDAGWLSALAAGFAQSSDVSCVTGLVAPRSLATPAQLLFEEWGSSTSRGFIPTVFRLVRPGSFRVQASPQYGEERTFSVYATGDFGIGSNMAFQAGALRAAGGFDEALGVGTRARAGEDIAAFINLLRRGEALAYAPDALSWHAHRDSVAELAGQLYGYGIGFTAMLCALLAGDPRHIYGLAAHAVTAVRGMRDDTSAKNAGRAADFPRALAHAELRGMLAGPWHYFRARARAGRRAAGMVTAVMSRPA